VFAWPTFLNAALLFGTAAFSIPLIIHLLHRTRYTTLEWGAMFFLEDLRRVQTRRIEWQSLLLLLIRCAIPVLLALCMARPLLSNRLSNAILEDGHPNLATIIVDNSLSMDAIRNVSVKESKSSIDQARQDVSRLVHSTSRQTRWSIQAMSGSSDPDSGRVFSRDRSVLDAAIKGINSGAGPGDLMDAIDLAVSDMASETEKNSRLVVVSDFQKSFCDSLDSNRIKTFRERLQQFDNPPSLVFLHTVPPKDRLAAINNVAVHVDRQTTSVIGVNQPWEVRVVVKNFGMKEVDQLKLVVIVDDVPMVSKTLSIPGQAESQAIFNFTFPEIGSRRIVARLETVDDLATDNEAYWSVLTVGAIPVLIVDPTLDSNQDRADSDFLQIAMAPFTGNANIQEDLFDVLRINPNKLSSLFIDKARIIVLCDIPKLPDALAKSLLTWMQDGGVLLCFSGERLNADWYNKNFFPDSEFKLADKPTVADTLGSGQRLLRETIQHPAFRFLNDSRMSGLDSLDVTQWYSCTIPSTSKSIVRLLNLSNGDPLMIEQKCGSGSLLFCMTTCDDRWTNWPMRPVYLPMIQQLLISQTPAEQWASNVETGRALSLPPAKLVDWIANTDLSKASSKDVALTAIRFRTGIPIRPSLSKDPQSSFGVPNDKPKTPSQTSVPTESGSIIDPDLVMTSVMANHPGFYPIDNAVESSLYVSAQASLSESDLSLESTAELQLIADQFGAKIVDNAEAYQQLGDTSGQEVWRWLLGCLLFLLFAELLLQRQFVGAQP
jgi:Aerotolerance regulator N-terminal